MFTRIRRAIDDPGRIKRAIQRRMPGTITVGNRAVTKKVKFNGVKLFKKEYRDTADGKESIQRELLARKIYSEYPWIIPINKQGHNWIALPYVPDGNRLDHAVKSMDKATKNEVVKQALSMLLDVHTAGYFHGDLHSKNLFWYKGQLLLCDFETMDVYKIGMRPPFPDSYDLTGNDACIEKAVNPNAPKMYYSAQTLSNNSMESTVGIPLKNAIEQFTESMREELLNVCSQFQSNKLRHTIRAARIYGSFTLPFFQVKPQDAQRDSAKRLDKLGVSIKELEGATLLDLGCNIGSMIFESQKFGPGRCIGVEYDDEKVRVANRMAAYNGLNNVKFIQSDIDKLTATKLGSTFDIVYCFALIEHLQDRDSLYRLLGDVTKRILLFEGNSNTSKDEIERKLLANGFKSVRFVGNCDDDCMTDNNRRPMYVAEK